MKKYEKSLYIQVIRIILLGIENTKGCTDLEAAANMALHICYMPFKELYNSKTAIFPDKIAMLNSLNEFSDFADRILDTAETKRIRAGALYDLARLYLDDSVDEKSKISDEYLCVMLNKSYMYFSESIDVQKRLINDPRYDKTKNDYIDAAGLAAEFATFIISKSALKILDFSAQMMTEVVKGWKPNSNDYLMFGNILWDSAIKAENEEKERFYEQARLNFEKSIALGGRAKNLYIYGEMLAMYSLETNDSLKQSEMREEAINVFNYYDERTGKIKGAKAIDKLLGNHEK